MQLTQLTEVQKSVVDEVSKSGWFPQDLALSKSCSGTQKPKIGCEELGKLIIKVANTNKWFGYFIEVSFRMPYVSAGTTAALL